MSYFENYKIFLTKASYCDYDLARFSPKKYDYFHINIVDNSITITFDYNGPKTNCYNVSVGNAWCFQLLLTEAWAKSISKPIRHHHLPHICIKMIFCAFHLTFDRRLRERMLIIAPCSFLSKGTHPVIPTSGVRKSLSHRWWRLWAITMEPLWNIKRLRPLSTKHLTSTDLINDLPAN